MTGYLSFVERCHPSKYTIERQGCCIENNNATFNLQGHQASKAELFDQYGRLVGKYDLEREKVIDVRGLDTGLYFVKMLFNDSSKESQVLKVIKF